MQREIEIAFDEIKAFVRQAQTQRDARMQRQKIRQQRRDVKLRKTGGRGKAQDTRRQRPPKAQSGTPGLLKCPHLADKRAVVIVIEVKCCGWRAIKGSGGDNPALRALPAICPCHTRHACQTQEAV